MDRASRNAGTREEGEPGSQCGSRHAPLRVRTKPPADLNGGDMEPVTSPSASPVDRRCEACGYTPITEKDKETQTDPLVFPYLGPNGYELVAVPQVPVFPQGTKFWL